MNNLQLREQAVPKGPLALACMDLGLKMGLLLETANDQ